RTAEHPRPRIDHRFGKINLEHPLSVSLHAPHERLRACPESRNVLSLPNLRRRIRLQLVIAGHGTLAASAIWPPSKFPPTARSTRTSPSTCSEAISGGPA